MRLLQPTSTMIISLTRRTKKKRLQRRHPRRLLEPPAWNRPYRKNGCEKAAAATLTEGEEESRRMNW